MQLDDRIEHAPAIGLRPGARRADQRRAVSGDVPSDDDLPPELAFLSAQGVAPALLLRAARIADDLGMAGEDALFGLGFPDERYGRLLARHLGAP